MLADALRDELGIGPEQGFPSDQLATVVELDVTYLTTLEGFQCLPNLARLALVSASLEDAGPLAGLALTQLTLTRSSVPSFTALSAAETPLASSLRYLRVFASQLSDLRGIERLAALSELDLQANRIEDLAPLGGLEELEQLNLSENMVSDLSPLRAAVRLQSLTIDDNRITSLAALNGHPSLEFIEARGNELVTLDGLEIPELFSLHVGGNAIESLGELSGVASLNVLSLPGNPLEHLAGIETLTRVREVDLSKTAVVDLEPVASLQSLEELDLTETMVSLLGPLAQLENVRELRLGYTATTDLAPLSPWARLTLNGACGTLSVEGLMLDENSRSVVIPSLCGGNWQVLADDPAFSCSKVNCTGQ